MKTKLIFLANLILTINIIFAQDSLPYLGQTPPSSIPERFGPDYLHSDNTWSWMGSPTFSLDGKEMYYSKYLNNYDQVKMYIMKDIDGVWTTPQVPDFVGNTPTDDPFFFKDNNNIYVKRDVTNSNNFQIYIIQRNGNTWNPAQLIAIPYNNSLGSISNFSITNDSTFYFTLHTAQGAFIYKSKLVNGFYSAYEILPNQINSYNCSSPFIEKDEKYLIFESERPGGYGSSDLYISFKNNDNWSFPINLGSQINSSSWEYAPKITPDGQYLFFCSKRAGDINSNAYWVDADIIDQLNPFAGISNNCNNHYSFSVFPNPFNDKISIGGIENQVVDITIYNVLGELVWKKRNVESGYNFDLSFLTNGFYVVNISGSKATEQHKLLKK